MLVVAIWVRAAIWLALGLLAYFCPPGKPTIVLVALLVLLFGFSFAGGVAGIPFIDIWGKALPATLRGRFFGHRQLWGGLMAVGAGKVDLLNADCEGSELLMLYGAERTLRAYGPQIFCEVHRSYLEDLGQSVADLAGYLRQLSFEVKPVSVDHPDSKVDFDECSHIYTTTRC